MAGTRQTMGNCRVGSQSFKLRRWLQEITPLQYGQIPHKEPLKTFNLEFQFQLAGAADTVETSQSKTVRDSSESATRFDINFDITNTSFSAGSDITIDLEYSGGEEGENPLTGGSSTEQIVVLTSSIEHHSGLSNMSLNHY